jgi:uncharacterized membrane protein YhhN
MRGVPVARNTACMSRLSPALSPILLPALIASATLAIAAAPWALNQPELAWIFKPLATLLVIAHAWPRGSDQLSARHWVRLGLIWSLVGDVALLWPEKGFLPGLVSFLLAHLAYLMAFTRGTRLAQRWAPFGAYALVAAVVLAALWPGVPVALRWPVLAYVLCLGAMAAQAAVVWRAGRERGAVLAAGGALFMLSDALLATNKFAGPLPLASLWVLSSYWAAQWCIASWLRPR